MKVFVQKVGDEIVAAFSCAQDPEHWPNVVEIDDADPKYLDFLANNSPHPDTATAEDQE